MNILSKPGVRSRILFIFYLAFQTSCIAFFFHVEFILKKKFLERILLLNVFLRIDLCNGHTKKSISNSITVIFQIYYYTYLSYTSIDSISFGYILCHIKITLPNL